jgi:photosystem II stability/assembly factor-like uncharacterized protein
MTAASASVSRHPPRSGRAVIALVPVVAVSLLAGAVYGAPARARGRSASRWLQVERTHGRCVGCATPMQLGQLQFVSKSEGWATASYVAPVGNGNGWTTILHTTDGGHSWTELPFVGEVISGGAEFAFSFSDRQRGWISWINNGAHDSLSETKNAGQTWSHRPSPVPGTFGYLKFFDRQRGWAVAPGFEGISVAITADGGTTWNIKTLPIKGFVCATSLDRQTLWVLGLSQTAPDKHLRLGISDDFGQNWQWRDVTAVHHMVERVYACELIDRQQAWLVVWLDNDKGSYLLRTHDGGRSWVRQPTDAVDGTGRYLTALTFLSAKVGLAFTDDLGRRRHQEHFMLSTLDGGDTWQSQASDSSVASCQVVSGVAICASGMDLLRIARLQGPRGLGRIPSRARSHLAAFQD